MHVLLVSLIIMAFLLWSHSVLTRLHRPEVKLAAGKKYWSRVAIDLGLSLFMLLLCLALSYMLQRSLTPEIYSTTVSGSYVASSADNVDSSSSNPRHEGKGRSEFFTLVDSNKVDTKFKDVAGLYEAKDEVQDIVKYLQNPTEFQRIGAKPPKGLLLNGPPGTGKTLLARAMAGEAAVTFISVSGSQFDEMYIGVGASRVRQLFELAREHAPCVIFIDEIDAMAYKRTATDHAWMAQTINQLLAEMDGLDNNKNKGIVVVGATNRTDMLDPAILRPGRFDRHTTVSLPTLAEREEIAKVHMQKVKTDGKITAKDIAGKTRGFSGAEIANLINEAAIDATKKDKKAMDRESIDVALDRLILGSKHKAMRPSDKEKELTAYHEAGHALVAMYEKAHDPIYKVTIMPLGQSLGHTSYQPLDERYSYSRAYLEARIAAALGGRVAEEIIFGEQGVTTGAESDFRAATQIAHNMVTKWGFSKKYNNINYGDATDNMLDKKVVEAEVNAILEQAHKRAYVILTTHKDELHKLSKALQQRETLDSGDVRKLLAVY